MRKPLATSRLKTRPPEKQREIYEYLQGHSVHDTRDWLAQNGIRTSVEALQDFYRWYPLAAPLHAASDMGEKVKEILRELPALQVNERQLAKAAHAIFEAQALQAQDSKLFLSLRKLEQGDRALDLQTKSAETRARQQDEELALAERRLALLEARAKEVVQTVQSKLTPEEQARRIRQIFQEE